MVNALTSLVAVTALAAVGVNAQVSFDIQKPFVQVENSVTWFPVSVGFEGDATGMIVEASIDNKDFVGEVHDLSLNGDWTGKDPCQTSFLFNDTIVLGQRRKTGVKEGIVYNDTAFKVEVEPKVFCYGMRGGPVTGVNDTIEFQLINSEGAVVDTHIWYAEGTPVVHPSVFAVLVVTTVILAIVIAQCTRDCMKTGCTKSSKYFDEE